MQLRDFEISIKCEDQTLTEYDVQFEDDKMVTCYIASEVGKTFEIHWSDRMAERPDGTGVRFNIDGHILCGNFSSPGCSSSRWGVRTSSTSRAPFQFAPLVTTDDDGIASFEGINGMLGTIEVKLERRKIVRQRAFSPVEIPDIGPVHEKSKKTGIHRVFFGDPRSCHPNVEVDTEPVNPEEGHFAQFIFRYRPKDILLAQGIIPSAPPVQAAAVGSSQKRKNPRNDEENASKKRQKEATSSLTIDDVKPDVSSLSANSGGSLASLESALAAVQGQLQTIQSQILAIKTGESSSQDVKREPAAIHIKAEDIGGVIDLTVDD